MLTCNVSGVHESVTFLSLFILYSFCSWVANFKFYVSEFTFLSSVWLILLLNNCIEFLKFQLSYFSFPDFFPSSYPSLCYSFYVPLSWFRLIICVFSCISLNIFTMTIFNSVREYIDLHFFIVGCWRCFVLLLCLIFLILHILYSFVFVCTHLKKQFSVSVFSDWLSVGNIFLSHHNE